MPRGERDIGREILEGIRELKRGQHGRITTVPSVASIREKTGLSQQRFAELLARIIREAAEVSPKTNASVWYKGRAYGPFATTEALA